jgi:hypothetical protein
MLLLPSDLLPAVLSRVSHSNLDLLLCTSRRLRAAVKQHIAQRCGLARSVFNACADELCRQKGSSRERYSAVRWEVYEGSRDGQLVVTIDIRMQISLVYDRLKVEVTEDRDVNGVLIAGAYAPVRLDVITVRPTENRVDRNLNGDVLPPIPVPEDLCDYLCTNFMGPPQDDELEFECVTDGEYGFY